MKLDLCQYNQYRELYKYVEPEKLTLASLFESVGFLFDFKEESSDCVKCNLDSVPCSIRWNGTEIFISLDFSNVSDEKIGETMLKFLNIGITISDEEFACGSFSREFLIKPAEFFRRKAEKTNEEKEDNKREVEEKEEKAKKRITDILYSLTPTHC